MKEKLKRLLLFFSILSIPVGFLIEHDHPVFWWHRFPLMDAVVGGIGALLLLFLIKVIATFASRKEDFYD